MDSDTIRYCGGFALCARKRFPDCFLPSMSSASAWRTFGSYAQGLVRSVQFRIVGNFGILDMILIHYLDLQGWYCEPSLAAKASCCKSNDGVEVVSMDAGPGVASSVDNIMEKVGLKEPKGVSTFIHIQKKTLVQCYSAIQ